MRARVIKKIADKFLLDGNYFCQARGTLKEQGIFVGDEVEFNKRDLVIEKVYERKNLLVRPPLANLDRMIIVIAPVPKPDLSLVDKLLIFCKINGILPVICVNKCDILAQDEKNKLERIYAPLAKLVFVSAEHGQVDELKKQIKGVCAFAGQSAVGKSSLINALHGEVKEEVGSLAKKTERGKQTTRIVSLYKLGAKDYIADTAGFSKLDEALLGIEARELCEYFDEFTPYIRFCKYLSCSHIKEVGCSVKAALKENKISLERYESYKKIYENLKGIKKYEKKN